MNHKLRINYISSLFTTNIFLEYSDYIKTIIVKILNDMIDKKNDNHYLYSRMYLKKHLKQFKLMNNYIEHESYHDLNELLLLEKKSKFDYSLFS